MTGGMAFIYDPKNEFENYVNSNSVIWQLPETQYWKEYLKSLITEHFLETKSKVAKIILDNFKYEINNFIQVCPKEMVDKLSNPITLKKDISKVI
jgi:glutamate synthase (NADPH/NADH) large chain